LAARKKKEVFRIGGGFRGGQGISLTNNNVGNCLFETRKRETEKKAPRRGKSKTPEEGKNYDAVKKEVF